MCYRGYGGCFTQVLTLTLVHMTNLIQLLLQMWAGQVVTGGSGEPLGSVECLELWLVSLHLLDALLPTLSSTCPSLSGVFLHLMGRQRIWRVFSAPPHEAVAKCIRLNLKKKFFFSSLQHSKVGC